MKCARCGRENSEQDKFCAYCGQKLNQSKPRVWKWPKMGGTVVLALALALGVFTFGSSFFGREEQAEPKPSTPKSIVEQAKTESNTPSKVVKQAETQNKNTGGKPTSEPQKIEENTISEKAKQYIGLRQGDIVRFGAYEQDNNTANGKEDIEWIVLYAHDEYVFLISLYGLDCQTYHDTDSDITWAECSLRKWLNGSFYNAAFSSDEKKLIETAYVAADENMEYNVSAGDNTMDNVYLLSSLEATGNFPDVVDRICTPTKYAVAQGAYLNNATNGGWWWLRTPGNGTNTAASINSDGTYDSDGSAANAQRGMVRPALWLKLY